MGEKKKQKEKKEAFQGYYVGLDGVPVGLFLCCIDLYVSKSNPNFDVMFLYDYFPYVKVACLCFLHVYSTNLIK